MNVLHKLVMMAMFAAIQLPIRTIRVRERLENLLKELNPAKETLTLIYETFNENCQASILTDHPRLVVNIDKHMVGVLKDYSTFIFCSDDNKWLKRSLRKLRKSNVWSPSHGPRGKFYILPNTSDLQAISDIFWQYEITDVTLLQRQDKLVEYNKNHSAKGKTIGNHHPEPTYEVYTNFVKIPKFRKIIVIMHDPWNRSNGDIYLRGLNKVVYESIKIIADHLNVEITYVDSSALKNLHTMHDGNLWVYVYRILKPPWVHNVDQTSGSYFIDTYTWIIPRVAEDTTRSMIFTFNWEVWLTLVSVLIFVVIASWLLSKLLRENSALQSSQMWVLVYIQLMVGFSSPTMPRSTTLKILFIFFILYSFLASVWFQSFMTSVLTDSPEQPDVHSVLELSESSIPLVTHQYNYNLLKREYPSYYRMMKGHIIINKTLRNESSRLEYCERHNCAVLMGKELLPYFYSKYLAKFYPLDYDSLYQLSQYLFVRQGHYFLNKLNFFRSAIIEAGFIQRILLGIKSKYDKQENEEKDPTANIYLRFQHLREVFLFLLFGLFLGAIALFIELAYYHLYDKRRLRKSIP